jgi:hypothetical protein
MAGHRRGETIGLDISASVRLPENPDKPENGQQRSMRREQPANESLPETPTW